jgi:hypothetical protein
MKAEPKSQHPEGTPSKVESTVFDDVKNSRRALPENGVGVCVLLRPVVDGKLIVVAADSDDAKILSLSGRPQIDSGIDIKEFRNDLGGDVVRSNPILFGHLVECNFRRELLDLCS